MEFPLADITGRAAQAPVGLAGKGEEGVQILPLSSRCHRFTIARIQSPHNWSHMWETTALCIGDGFMEQELHAYVLYVIVQPRGGSIELVLQARTKIKLTTGSNC